MDGVVDRGAAVGVLRRSGAVGDPAERRQAASELRAAAAAQPVVKARELNGVTLSAPALPRPNGHYAAGYYWLSWSVLFGFSIWNREGLLAYQSEDGAAAATRLQELNRAAFREDVHAEQIKTKRRATENCAKSG
ncbi:hypothetical protein [Azospirillum canadense]|uniref:hypothetical protein n=1 Tax=Azospirillum canadense TaxID=403962 RepID=UPI00222786F0|nr:hypothetical protein [Azospirillum canadense]MCW2242215.1 hypothetical protein [Azospirillum canadense]